MQWNVLCVSCALVLATGGTRITFGTSCIASQIAGYKIVEMKKERLNELDDSFKLYRCWFDYELHELLSERIKSS